MNRLVLLAVLSLGLPGIAMAQTSAVLGTAGGGNNTLVFNNATSGTLTVQPVTGALGSSVATLPANTGTVAETNLAQTFTAPTRTSTETPAIATTTFTPVFTGASGANNHRIDFPATTCTCTIANPSSLVAGQSGVFELVQGATSASLNPTWGSEYEFAGGTSSIVLSTGLGAIDYIGYYVDSTGSFIVLFAPNKAPSH
jgi:hypothetical protein